MLMLVSFPKQLSLCANRKFSFFEMALRVRSIYPVGSMEGFIGGDFILGCGNLTRSVFDHLNLFPSQKQHFVHIECKP